jgi:hypothetical protein
MYAAHQARHMVITLMFDLLLRHESENIQRSMFVDAQQEL